MLIRARRYITIDKSFFNRKPLTRARITKAGRKAFASYITTMTKLIEDVR